MLSAQLAKTFPKCPVPNSTVYVQFAGTNTYQKEYLLMGKVAHDFLLHQKENQRHIAL